MSKVKTMDFAMNFAEPYGFEDSRAVVVDGVHADIGCRVLRWNEKKGCNGYVKKKVVVKREDRKTGKIKTEIIQGSRYKKRAGGINAITQIFIHHSGGDGDGGQNCYNTLYMNRGLSVQFFQDDDGKIWQFNDAVDHCKHAGKHNRLSIGIECALYPLADERPGYYREERRKRTGNLLHTTRVERIHGRKIHVFCFTDEQTETLARWAAGLWLALGMTRTSSKHRDFFSKPPRFPRNTKNKIPRTVIKNPLAHVGLIGHLQCTRNKIDPAGFPWEAFEARVTECWHEFRGNYQEV